MIRFWKNARSMVHSSHDIPKLDGIVKKIVTLALSKYPIRSLDEYYGRYFDVGGIRTANGKIHREDVSDKDIASIERPIGRDGRYYSIVEACLVSMMEEVEGRLKRMYNFETTGVSNDMALTQLSNEDMWVLLDDLIPEIDRRLNECCPSRLTRPTDHDNGSAHYNEPSTKSAEYLQIKKLLKKTQDEEMPFLKQHARRGKVLFELTTVGYSTAKRIRDRSFPESPGHYRVSNLSTIPPRFKNICMAVDKREGGGPSSKLHLM